MYVTNLDGRRSELLLLGDGGPKGLLLGGHLIGSHDLRMCILLDRSLRIIAWLLRLRRHVRLLHGRRHELLFCQRVISSN